MPDSIVITATALALAKDSRSAVPGSAAALGSFAILRLPEEPVEGRHTRLSSRLSRLTRDLAAQAGLRPEDLAGPGTGLVSGSRYGCSLVADMHRRLREQGPRGIDPVGFAQATHNFPVSACAIELGIQGPGIALVSSGAAGMEALICGHDWLREGRCARVIVAAYEDLEGPAAAHLALLAGANAAPVHEAMALVMLERGTAARRRGQPILAEIAGTAMLRPSSGPEALHAAGRRLLGSGRQAFGILMARPGGPQPPPPLVECLAVGGLLALIRALDTAAPRAWLVGAMDPRCGGIAAGLVCGDAAAPLRDSAPGQEVFA